MINQIGINCAQSFHDDISSEHVLPSQCKHQLAARLGAALQRVAVYNVPDVAVAELLANALHD
jgi:hypothetical protein